MSTLNCLLLGLGRKLLLSLKIVLEGVLIAIVAAIVTAIFVLPYAAFGLCNWSWDRIVAVWAGNE